MGLSITAPTKTVTGTFDEAWRTNIEGTPLTDPVVTCHRQEVTYYDDGTYKTETTAGRVSDDFVKTVSFKMSEIVARTGTLAYKDATGADKTVPESDVPFIVKALIDLMGQEARTAKSQEEPEA